MIEIQLFSSIGIENIEKYEFVGISSRYNEESYNEKTKHVFLTRNGNIWSVDLDEFYPCLGF